MGDSGSTFEPTGPAITCKAAKETPSGDWDAVHRLFRDAIPCGMRQAWLEQQESAFRPCSVRCVWRPDALWILAELEDDDIFNPAKQFNEPTFMLGDAFEIFLRPARQEAYYEFHVSPENQRFQLRIPGRGQLAAAVKVAAFQIDSRARAIRERRRWEVLAGIPFAHVAEQGQPREGDHWLFSFSRYDYTQGVEQPVLSSTSPHAKCGFHRMEEWGTLLFAGK